MTIRCSPRQHDRLEQLTPSEGHLHRFGGGPRRAGAALSRLPPLIVAGNPHPISAARARAPAATRVGWKEEQDAVFGLTLADPGNRRVREEFDDAFGQPCSQALRCGAQASPVGSGPVGAINKLEDAGRPPQHLIDGVQVIVAERGFPPGTLDGPR